MLKLKCFFILTMLVPLVGFAQSDSTSIDSSLYIDEYNVEEVTYKMYLDQDWKNLSTYGEWAIRQVNDYYYLRMRTAIAWYELGKYRAATLHFEKAHAMNPFEEAPKEYLYWCYNFTERYEEAARISKLFAAETARNTGTVKSKKISFYLLESGIKPADKSSVSDPMYYVHAGVGHMVKRKIYFFHGVTALKQTMYWGGYSQAEYYLKANIPLRKGWSISPTAHVLYLDASPYTKGTYAVISAAASKQFRYFQLNAGLSASTLLDSTMFQAHAGARVFPLGHNRLWIGSVANTVVTDAGKSANFFQHTFYWYPLKKWSFSGSFQHGNARLFNESNGYIVNSSLDLLRNRTSLMASWYIKPRLEIYGLVQNEQKTEYFNGTTYQFNNLILGLKFKP